MYVFQIPGAAIGRYPHGDAAIGWSPLWRQQPHKSILLRDKLEEHRAFFFHTTWKQDSFVRTTYSA
jgi:hypothetical protein